MEDEFKGSKWEGFRQVNLSLNVGPDVIASFEEDPKLQLLVEKAVRDLNNEK